ncbi:hypothetical protein [Bradyrhizobium sp. URHA0013]|uniref:hypothetical protein n=1 Tax=Bradyrhizobium sp. URHA0013 TaxID=1380352 RepID=UPI00047F5804|nr:hypothetical protein [Bradyrhizobium sp. URHA0013]
MSDSDLAPANQTPPNPVIGRVFLDERALSSAQLPFGISLMAIFAMLVLFTTQAFFGFRFSRETLETDSALVRFLLPNSIYIALFVIAILGAYIGFRLLIAAGATTAVVIPPQDYALLAPLVAGGKAESIDQYVRLSSLSKFTGTFTQLGLTGLPLATIALTLFFSILALARPESFLDLTKLTLGAFIGSFVQRQVERRADQRDGAQPSDLKEL